MTKPILVFALDKYGFELNTPFHEGEESMRAARIAAGRLLHHPETIAAGLYKVEIRRGGECVWDAFVK